MFLVSFSVSAYFSNLQRISNLFPHLCVQPGQEHASIKGRLSMRAPGMRRPCQKASKSGALERCHSGTSISSSLPDSGPQG